MKKGIRMFSSNDFLVGLLAIAMTMGMSPLNLALASQNISNNKSNSVTAGKTDLLVKLKDENAVEEFTSWVIHTNGNNSNSFAPQRLGPTTWVRVQVSSKIAQNLKADGNTILAVQPNYPIHLLQDYKIQDPQIRARLLSLVKNSSQHLNENNEDQDEDDSNGDIFGPAKADNPPIPQAPTTARPDLGTDPLFNKQWGMVDLGIDKIWALGPQGRGQGMIVAVLDTGVDYTHEDLRDNLWRNPGEIGLDASGKDKATNGLDDDGNGYVDDVVGWDFAAKDNFPYDLATEGIQLLIGGGNPGHGTHCAGNVAAQGRNGIGIAGAAPDAQIMALRFISEKGQGTSADAILAIQYAVKMGAKILSNSWGSEGEDPKEDQENKALREAIVAAQNAGVLFVAAAGNGHKGVGYDNDKDSAPGYPASYPYDNIISVAAIGSNNQLGSFSNWGKTSVDLAAPGVQVFSTVVGNKYNDMVFDKFGITVGWDGTSMATPHVAGAAAAYWSSHPQATWQEVKAAILKSAQPVDSLQDKLVTGGKLHLETLLNM